MNMESNVNNPQRGDRIFSAHNNHHYDNGQDLDDSLQQEIPYYISLHGSVGDECEYVEPDSIVPNGITARPDVGTGDRRTGGHSYQPNSLANTNATSIPYVVARMGRNDDHSYKKSGHRRKFIMAIVVLVALLAAVMTSFGFLYFKRKDNHSGIQIPETSTETTLKTSTPKTTVGISTTSTPPTTPGPPSRTTTTFTSPSTEGLTTGEKCERYGGLVADSTWCHAYYDCSKEEKALCPFPKLFSSKTKSCEDFESVVCGERKEAKHECDYYESDGCVRCRPCIREFCNCEGKPDGLNVHDGRLWTQHYVICYKERCIGEYTCPIVDDMQQYFSPVYNACVDKFRIPPQYGGLMPNCTGKADGTYPNEFAMCRYYTECAWGQFVRSVLCPDWQKYDELLKECTHSPTNMCVCNKVTGC